MWQNRSLIYPAILFLLLAIGATLAVGYAINFAILEDVLQERMSRQAEEVGKDVLQALEGKAKLLERFRNSWMENADWNQEAENDPNLVDNQQENTPAALAQQLSELLPLWGVDFLLILDPSGEVIQRTPAGFASTHPLPPSLVELARTQASRNGAAWHLAQIEGQWEIMLLAPMRIDPMGAHHLLVFGQGLKKVVTQLQQENPDHPFLIAATDGIAAGSRISLGNARFQPEIVTQTINNNTPYMVFDSDLPVNLYYSPITFLDQTFSLVVPVALDDVRQILTNSRQRLFGSIVIIVLLLVGLGMATERILLRPLRQLREKAAVMVRACSHDEQFLFLDQKEQGNEIRMLERAMEKASIKLYTHVAHLLDTKFLLEGLALQDPITRLGNRRMLEEFLGRTLGACKRKSRQVAVILLEPEPLDKHPGLSTSEDRDQFHRELANRLRSHLRGEDLAFRVHGNEFVAFAPECGNEEQVTVLVQRLHRFLSQPYPLANGQEITVNLLMGVAIFPGAGESVDSLLVSARTALAKVRRQESPPPFAIVYR
ncbi:MAG: GGDEF domain-containing protein [Magnetococcales bacterium]|nr:GGDEF domain-containing protein [Magnetococcales bacterium]MBF0156303.1 GGDEF domain-containing protein [Magnetococcales bacterium]